VDGAMPVLSCTGVPLGSPALAGALADLGMTPFPLLYTSSLERSSSPPNRIRDTPFLRLRGRAGLHLGRFCFPSPFRFPILFMTSPQRQDRFVKLKTLSDSPHLFVGEKWLTGPSPFHRMYPSFDCLLMPLKASSRQRFAFMNCSSCR